MEALLLEGKIKLFNGNHGYSGEKETWIYGSLWVSCNKNVDIKLSVHDTVSRITFIRYAQYRNIRKPSNFKMFRSNKTKGSQNMIAKIS